MCASLCRAVLVLLFLSVGIAPCGVSAQTPAAAPKPACTADPHAQPSAAEAALAGRKFADAERLYGDMLAADPASGVAMAGLVRTRLGEDKLPEALTLATKYDGEHPNDAAILDALGEVRFRRGEVDEAAMALNRSVNLNPCNGLTHYDMARFLDLSGLHASAQRQIEVAHKLAPENQEISRRWAVTHAVPPPPEQMLAMLKRRLDSPSLTADQKDGINAAIAGMEARERGNCELATPVTETKLPIVPIPSGAPIETMFEAGIEVQLNGKKRRLEIDTGASGLVLSNSVAKRAGLVPEVQVKASGIGDSGPANVYVTHVDDIKVGGMEFKNCMVHVLPAGSVLDRIPDVDGLIGLDVFGDYLVTLDIPGFEVRLGPLPKRPDEQAGKATSLVTSEDQQTPVSIADSAKDRYVAPEMKDWAPVFRSQHLLIFPTSIGKAPTKLFLMDTGASHSMISPAAAREVTILSGFTNQKVMGVNGEVQDMLVADKVAITFGNVHQVLTGLQSFDTSNFSHSTGVDLAGIIGFPTLRELVITIDYRDNLVHVVYDPKKGYHPH
jgi:hypothetical protein